MYLQSCHSIHLHHHHQTPCTFTWIMATTSVGSWLPEYFITINSLLNSLVRILHFLPITLNTWFNLSIAFRKQPQSLHLILMTLHYLAPVLPSDHIVSNCLSFSTSWLLSNHSRPFLTLKQGKFFARWASLCLMLPLPGYSCPIASL